MGKNPERIAKPRNGLYKKIQNYTQHPRFAPKSLSWFICYFDETEERVKQAVDYLVFKRFLTLLPSGRYGVDRDVRTRITGRVFMMQGVCYVEPDAECEYNHMVFIPEKYTFGARHGDRVKAALDGYNMLESGLSTGVIEEIIAPLSDRFCGRIERDEMGLFVVPDFSELGSKIALQAADLACEKGDYVYAELINGDERREIAFQHASFSQQKKNLSVRIWGEDWKDAESYAAPEPVCRVVKQVPDCFADRFLNEQRFFAPLSVQATQEAFCAGKRTNFMRKEFLNHTICMVHNNLAFHLEKEKTDVRLFVHVPDMCEDIYPGTALETELRYKGFGEDLVPDVVRQRVSFGLKNKARSFTAELKIDCLGAVHCVDFYRSRICCTTRKVPQFYSKIKRFLPMEYNGLHPVQQAAEYALANYFSARGKIMPYAGVVLNRTAEAILPYFTQNDYDGFPAQLKGQLLYQWERNEKEPLTSLKPLLFDRVLSVCPQGMFVTVPFGNPFQNFASILTQWAMVYHSQKHHNKEENARFEAYMKESVAVCRQQQIYLTEYEILRRKEKWLQENNGDGKTLHEGVVVGFLADRATGLRVAIVLQGENLIYCFHVPKFISVGEPIKLTILDKYRGTAMLVGEFRAKEDF